MGLVRSLIDLLASPLVRCRAHFGLSTRWHPGNHYTSLATLCLFVSFPSFASHHQVQGDYSKHLSRLESGAPILRNFLPQEYKAQGQNWALVQNKKGFMYVGNNDGVLEYDGERWRTIPVANQTTVRSLCIDENDRIYVGAVGELGYLDTDELGNTRYVSLMQRIATADKKFSEVWRCFVTPKGVVFTTFQKIFRIANQQVDVWRTSSIFLPSFYVNQRLFTHELKLGLLELVNDEMRLIPDGKRFANDKVYAILPWHEEKNPRVAHHELLIGTRQQGFLIFDGKHYRPWKTEVDQELKTDLLYNGLRLQDGRLAFGTIQGGLYILDANGRLLSHLDRTSGLPDQAIYSSRLDASGGLWLTLDRGIARIEVNNPLTQFHENNGLIGAVLNAHRFQGRLYAATTQGIFEMHPGPHAHFKRIEGTDGPSWHMVDWQDQLLIANYQGIYQLYQGKLSKLASIDSTFVMVRPRQHPDLLLVGARHGLFVLRYRDQTWENLGSVGEVNDEIRSMVEDEQGRWWLGTNTSGVLRLSFKNLASTPQQANVERFNTDHGLPSMIKNWPYRLRQSIRFGSNQGVLRFDEQHRRFEADPDFSQLFPTPRPVYSLYEDHQGGIWMYSHDKAKGKEELGQALPQADGKYLWSFQAFRAIAGERAEGMFRVSSEADGIIWLSGTKGLFRFDPHRHKDYQARYPTMIRQVSNAHELIYGGGDESKKPSLDYQDNRLRFDYAAPSFDGIDANQYQVFLEGSDRQWSDWSREIYRDYSNLYEGEYRFRVRAKNLYDTMSEEASFAFVIHAPWYRSPIAYLIYLLLLAGSAKAFINWRTERLNAQKNLLEKQVQERTRELENAYAEIKKISITDPLTGLGNRRYWLQAMEHYHPQEQNAGAPVTLDKVDKKWAFMLIDIDHFKMVNDSHGHTAGDAILVGFADILRAHCRRDDIAVRWGGEEFLMCAQVHDEQDALNCATRLRLAVGRANFAIGQGHSLKITCSIGLACWPFDHKDPHSLTHDDIIHLADAALYIAKRSGRNLCVNVIAAQDLPVESKLLIHTDVQHFLHSKYVHLVDDRQNQ